MVPKMR
ncbi:hypothetical protein TIFTF001_029951 [Ficus carica]|jgi:hypothetical protein|nr:hypothetical protein TIFTF001_029951 [Ficus carica]